MILYMLEFLHFPQETTYQEIIVEFLVCKYLIRYRSSIGIYDKRAIWLKELFQVDVVLCMWVSLSWVPLKI